MNHLDGLLTAASVALSFDIYQEEPGLEYYLRHSKEVNYNEASPYRKYASALSER
jgi:hypothetical protein